MHPVALVTIVGPLVAFITSLSTVAGAHPAHALCPERNRSGFSAMSFAVNFPSDISIILPPFTPSIRDNAPTVLLVWSASFFAGLQRLGGSELGLCLFLPIRI